MGMHASVFDTSSKLLGRQSPFLRFSRPETATSPVRRGYFSSNSSVPMA